LSDFAGSAGGLAKDGGAFFSSTTFSLPEASISTFFGVMSCSVMWNSTRRLVA